MKASYRSKVAEHLSLLVKMDEIAYNEVMLLTLNTFPMVTIGNKRVQNFDILIDRITVKEAWLSQE